MGGFFSIRILVNLIFKYFVFIDHICGLILYPLSVGEYPLSVGEIVLEKTSKHNNLSILLEELKI